MAIVLLSTACAILAAVVTTPVYRATVTLLPAESKNAIPGLGAALGNLGTLGSLVGLGAGETQNTVEAVALLGSRDFAESFIRDRDLTRLLFANRWDTQRSGWRLSWWAPAPPTLYDAYRKFDRSVRRVSEDKKTGLVTVEVDWTDRDQGAQWANEMVARVNATMRQRAIADADASIELLTDELRSAGTIELRDAIARTLESYVKARALAKVTPDYAFRVIDPGKPTGPRDYIRPNRFLYVFAGVITGFIIAVLVAMTLDALRRRRQVQPITGQVAACTGE
jgi:uncharacterized protein involved in exopolysaccharide biosynthesis